MSASLIGRPGSSTCQTFHQFSVDAARGLVLLFGIGTKALPSWDLKTRWNNLRGGLTVNPPTVGPSGHTILPLSVVPRGDIIPLLSGTRVSSYRLNEMVLAQGLGDEDRQAPRAEKGDCGLGASIGRITHP